MRVSLNVGDSVRLHNFPSFWSILRSSLVCPCFVGDPKFLRESLRTGDPCGVVESSPGSLCKGKLICDFFVWGNCSELAWDRLLCYVTCLAFFVRCLRLGLARASLSTWSKGKVGDPL